MYLTVSRRALFNSPANDILQINKDTNMIATTSFILSPFLKVPLVIQPLSPPKRRRVRNTGLHQRTPDPPLQVRRTVLLNQLSQNPVENCTINRT